MTVQELQEIMSQRFDAQEQYFKALFAAQEQRFKALFAAQEQQFNARFDAQEQRQDDFEARMDRFETRMDRMEDKLDKVLELVAIQHGERASTARFWKHAAWFTPTVIALAALIKSFFL